MIDPGQMRWRVAFDAPLVVEDDLGAEEVSFGEGSPYPEPLECYAHFKWIRTGETVQQARLAGRQVIAVTIRANAVSETINAAWRMRDLDTGAVYNVRGVEPVAGTRHLLEVLVEGGEVVE